MAPGIEPGIPWSPLAYFVRKNVGMSVYKIKILITCIPYRNNVSFFNLMSLCMTDFFMEFDTIWSLCGIKECICCCQIYITLKLCFYGAGYTRPHHRGVHFEKNIDFFFDAIYRKYVSVRNIDVFFLIEYFFLRYIRKPII